MSRRGPGGCRPPLALFAAELRQLQRRSGGPSVRQLAALMSRDGTPFARSTVHDKLVGVSKPSWAFVRAFVRACHRHCPALTGTPDLDRWYRSYCVLLRDLAAVDGLPTAGQPTG
jgi:hypothetical protein